MPVQFANPSISALMRFHAKDKVRLRNTQTGLLLHLSGKGTTHSVKYSWLGSRLQAETLKSRAEARGEDWPFVPVHRNVLDPPDSLQID